MGRFKLAIAAALLIALGGWFFQRDDMSSVPNEQNLSEIEVSKVEEITMARIERELSERFPDAPSLVQDIASEIMRGNMIAEGILADLSTEALNAGYSRALKNPKWGYQHTLLREAVVSGNAKAAEQLMAAGADPFFNQNEFPYLAVRWKPAPLAFPDYRAQNQMLLAWLKADGDPNAYNPAHGSLGGLLNSVPMNNLEAMILLLQSGADPWTRIMVQSTGSGPDYESESFLEMNSTAHPTTLELIFRLSKLKLIAPASPPEMEFIMAKFEGAVERVWEKSGPKGMGDKWRLHMALSAFVAATGAEPGPMTKELLAEDPAELAKAADGLAGFWLAEGETHSPEDEDQKVNSTVQHGTELWDG